jgi:hypothetical protein
MASFVVVRNARDLEDNAFFVALALFMVGAAVIAAALSFAVSRRLWIQTGIVAALLVPSLFVIYIIVQLIVCGITGCDMS